MTHPNNKKWKTTTFMLGKKTVGWFCDKLTIGWPSEVWELRILIGLSACFES